MSAQRKIIGSLPTALVSAAVLLLIGLICQSFSQAFAQSSTTDTTSFTNSVAVDGFTIAYPDGWSVSQSSNATALFNVPSGQLSTLDNQTLLHTAQIRVTIDHMQRSGRYLPALGRRNAKVRRL